jgi:hypothetical protein
LGISRHAHGGAYLDPGTSGRIVVALALAVITGGAPDVGAETPVLPAPYPTPSMICALNSSF